MDCILDLLDNSIDAARSHSLSKEDSQDNVQGTQEESPTDEPEDEAELGNVEEPDVRGYEGYFVRITFNKSKFEINDNCGGITIHNAQNYAFHFGRQKDTPSDRGQLIGLYGIGMKRAVFKMGESIQIKSSTSEDAFTVEIDVKEWLKKPNDWDFILTPELPLEEAGSTITVSGLREGVSEEFEDNTFKNNLVEIIARDYSVFLQKGFEVYVNGDGINPYKFLLKESDEIQPVRYSYTDSTGVNVDISAGMADIPPDESEPENLPLTPTDYFGWFVLCNDRVVLAADKSEDTIWGDENFPIWHPQYNGFMGIISFNSDDPNKLPWTTTKREIDESEPIYRRAVVKMKEVTRPFLSYTTRRKSDLERAKIAETKAISIPINQVKPRREMAFPKIATDPSKRKTSITYQRPVDEVEKVKQALGKRSMTNKEVGIKTFEYYIENEEIS